MKITLEQVDQVKERTGVSYAKAKNALEKANGDVLEAIIFIEDEKKVNSQNNIAEESKETIEELKVWLKDLIKKGNVSRIKISKENVAIVDVPVNAGIAAAIIAVILPPVLAVVLAAAVITKVTIEITKSDGSVEVVNKYLYKVMNEAKNKASNVSDKFKEKVSDINNEEIKKHNPLNKVKNEEVTTFTYTIDFDDK